MIHFYLFLALGIVLAATHGEEVVSLKKKKKNEMLVALILVPGLNFSSFLQWY